MAKRSKRKRMVRPSNPEKRVRQQVISHDGHGWKIGVSLDSGEMRAFSVAPRGAKVEETDMGIRWVERGPAGVKVREERGGGEPFGMMQCSAMVLQLKHAKKGVVRSVVWHFWPTHGIAYRETPEKMPKDSITQTLYGRRLRWDNDEKVRRRQRESVRSSLDKGDIISTTYMPPEEALSEAVQHLHDYAERECPGRAKVIATLVGGPSGLMETEGLQQRLEELQEQGLVHNIRRREKKTTREEEEREKDEEKRERMSGPAEVHVPAKGGRIYRAYW